MHYILIVEDDKALSNGIALALKQDNYFFVQAFNFKMALQVLKEYDFSLILLDLNLLNGNGLDLLCNIRKTSCASVIILTANDLEIDIVTGLELGADDYITKPFSLMVLRVRVNTQFRKIV